MIYKCPDCNWTQPAPGLCARCPGVTVAIEASVETLRAMARKPGVIRPCPRCHGSGIEPVHVGKGGCWACGGSGEEILYLCGACGAIRPQADYTMWKRDDEGDHWIPVENGDSDPMVRCPACGDEHTDTDTDNGLLEGTLAQLIASREAIVEEFDDAFQSEYRPAPLPPGNSPGLTTA